MKVNADRKNTVVTCNLCKQSFDSWLDERIHLHIESCSERKARLLTRCPSCSKVLSKLTALKHAKICANFLNISLYDLLLLNDVLPNTLSNNSKSCEPSKRSGPYLQAVEKISRNKTSRRCVNSVEHLLISLTHRKAIFDSRLSDILHKEHFAFNFSRYFDCGSSLSSPLWSLSSIPLDNKSPTNLDQFYVEPLFDLLTPLQRTKMPNPLRMSQIPGRSPSSIQRPHPLPLPETMQSAHIDCESFHLEMLSKMVGSSTCSDLSISLDSGESVPAHRFIMAAWSSELALLADTTSSISAPGMNKGELLHLLRGLYTFDTQILSSLSPEAEFTLDCWQMLKSVRNKVKSSPSSRKSITSAIKESASIREITCSSGVDLFASVVHNTNLPSPYKSPNQEMMKEEFHISSSNAGIEAKNEVLGKPAFDVDHTPSMNGFKLCPFPIPVQPTLISDRHSTPHPPQSVRPANSLEEYPLLSVSSPTHKVKNADVKSDEYLVVSVSSPEDEAGTMVNAQLPQSLSLSVNFDPPSFCEDYEGLYSFETQIPPLSGKKRSLSSSSISRHLDGGQKLCSPKLAEAEMAPSEVQKDSIFFFDASAPTPAPLAKRLCIEEAETVLPPPSQCLSPVYPSSSDKENNDECSVVDPQSPISLSQPAPCTPTANKRRLTSVILIDVPITPKPAFEAMPTPELRKTLSDYGIRQLPKKKAVQLLNHIYDELHPYVEVPSLMEGNIPVRENSAPGESFAVTSPNTTNSLTSRPVNNQNFLGGIFNSHREAPVDNQRTSESKTTLDQGGKDDALKARVWECLRSNDQLYSNIITYVPLELDCVKAMLRDAGISIGLRPLSDMLDCWGVTFTTRNRQVSNSGRNISNPRPFGYLW